MSSVTEASTSALGKQGEMFFETPTDARDKLFGCARDKPRSKTSAVELR